MTKVREKFYVAVEDLDKYKKLVEEGFFERRNKKDQFLMAMGFGLINDVPIEFKRVQEGEFFWKRDLGPDGEALINAVAICKKDDVDVLSNKEEVYTIAEQYAHGGIELLLNKYNSIQIGSFWKHFEKYIFDIYKQLNINDKKS